MALENKEIIEFKCHKIWGESAKGDVLISKEAICFYKVDTDTGTISEKGHVLEGQRITDKMLILPSGKGSSVVNDEGLFMLKQNKTGPKGIIVKNPDTILVAGAIIMDFPIFDRVEKKFYEFVADDDYLIVDADREVIQLFK